MSLPRIDPIYWTSAEIYRCGKDVVHEMALRASGTVAAYQYLAGRCLLAMKWDHWYQSFGYSSIIHYAIGVFGVSRKEAQRYYRVALQLERLPRLSLEAAKGRISWSKLREIASKASLQTEQLWIELAAKMTYGEIQELVARTEPGEWPQMSDSEIPEPELTEIRCRFGPITMEILGHVTRKLSEEAKRPLSTAEVLSQLCAERLAKGHPDEKFTRGVEKSVKLRRAYRRRRDEILVAQAREIARSQGLREPGVANIDDDVNVNADLDIDVAAGVGPARGQDNAGEDCGPARGRRDAGEDCGPARGQNDAGEDCGPARGHRDAGEQSGPAWDQSDTSDLEETGARASGIDERYANIEVIPCPGVPDLGLVKRQLSGPLNSRIKFNPKARLATPAQRDELLRRDCYGCCVPGCPHQLWLEAHHYKEFSRGGETSWENIGMTCSACHRNIHRGLLKITRNEDGTLTFRDAEGRDLRRAHDMQVAGWLNYWVGWLGTRMNCHQRRVAEGEWDAALERVAAG